MSTTLYNAWRNLPHWGVVFLDKNPAAIKSSGVLAYSTLEDAVASWRSGGEAYVRYGAPSDTNSAFILVGVGVFDTSSPVSLDVNFLTIMGFDRATSVIRAISGASANTVLIGAEFLNIINLTVDANNISSTAIDRVTSGLAQWSGRVKDVIVKNTTFGGSGLAIIEPTMNGTIEGLVGIATVTTLFLNVSTANARVLNCEFVSDENGSVPRAVILNGDFPGLIKDCRFTGGGSRGCLDLTGGSFTGTIRDCEFTNDAAGGAIKNSGGTFAGKLINCSARTTNNPLDSLISGARIIDCHLVATNSDQHAIGNVATGVVIKGCRLIGTGTGLAVNADDPSSVEITNCALRRPTGGNVGSSLSSNITNIAENGGSTNEELLSTTSE